MMDPWLCTGHPVRLCCLPGLFLAHFYYPSSQICCVCALPLQIIPLTCQKESTVVSPAIATPGLTYPSILGSSSPASPWSQRCDLIKGLLFTASCVILYRITDASQMYHSVRGQETIKLYVIFNVLEVRRLEYRCT